MLIERQYDRAKAVEYAKKWAFERNPKYYDFSNIGGDCTNFASQCVYAGSGVMNFTPVMGWFYRSVSDRTASWTGVEYFYNFMVNNKGVGPFGKEVDKEGMQIGDIVQFGWQTGDFYHSPVITGFKNGMPLLTTHTFDAYNKPMNEYFYERVRFIHIVGVRVWNNA